MPKIYSDLLPQLAGQQDFQFIETGIKEQDHLVQFYDNDSFLLDTLAIYVGTGLNQNDACITIATADHQRKLEERLEAYGIDIEKARNDLQYVSLNAAETLASFMVNGTPDKKKFLETVGAVIAASSKKRLRVRAFGEMVALLWKDGNQNGAIKLEQFWNGLSKKHKFSLFCAYPMEDFGTKFHENFSEIGIEHSKVIPSESYTKLNTPDDRLRAIALLQQKSKSLEAEIEERKLLEKQKDEFIILASHELKTPLTSLKGYAHILQNRLIDIGNKDLVEYAGKIDTQLNQLSALIHDLLDVTRTNNGKILYKFTPININYLVKEKAEAIQLTTSTHKLQLQLGKLGMVDADPNRIGQVILNFLTNAVKYSADSGKVIIKTKVENGNVVVCVRDFGIGIETKNQDRVFNKFFRVEGILESTYPGIGVGLYVSSEIIKNHAGKVWVESKKGKGSKFYFSIPLKQPTKSTT